MLSEWIRNEGIPTIQALIQQADSIIERENKFIATLDKELENTRRSQGNDAFSSLCITTLESKRRANMHRENAQTEKSKQFRVLKELISRRDQAADNKPLFFSF